jgi:hypothetical protein
VEPNPADGDNPDGGNTGGDNPHAENTVLAAGDNAPTHAARPGRPHYRLAAAACGLLAAVAALVVGGNALVKDPSQAGSAGPASASLITVDPRVPLTAGELSALVHRAPDFGDLADPKRRASCLNGLGYPGSMQVLGAAPVQVNGNATIVLVLPGDHPDELVALAVRPNCSSMGTGLIADTTVTRP